MRKKTKGVLDPQWEDELRAGQAGDDTPADDGSVEAQLAVVHLFRHAAAPEALEPDALDAVWSDVAAQIEAENGFVPWWRRVLDWRVGVGVAVAAAAALVVLMSADPEPAPSPRGEAVAQADGSKQLSATLQAQFEMLAPQARDEIVEEVEQGRSAVREQMLATLQPPPPAATPGGAP